MSETFMLHIFAKMMTVSPAKSILILSLSMKAQIFWRLRRTLR